MNDQIFVAKANPILACVTAAGLAAFPLAVAEEDAAGKPEVVLMDFRADGDQSEWRPENDGVMGGVSSGDSDITDGALHFSGEVSLENNGGFASVKAPVSEGDWREHDAIVLRVKGDGRTYQVRLATDERYRGSRISYRASFPTTEGSWTTARVPLSAFKPSHHGNMLEGPPLDRGDIEELRLMIADGNAGPFSLQVEWIGLE